ncbi:unnamed protein product [Protopolystoma xenopodis]|uniref:Uncharacterized protein n=1 Tax=Protopolystoma xenopodis TaxID=117903 RepID=A0A3S5CF75_9PLAT|nr:unnamed protein product [Protopolystoma xenopodis]
MPMCVLAGIPRDQVCHHSPPMQAQPIHLAYNLISYVSQSKFLADSRSAQAIRKIIADHPFLQSPLHQVALKEDVYSLPDLPLSAVLLILGHSFRCTPANCVVGQGNVFNCF